MLKINMAFLTVLKRRFLLIFGLLALILALSSFILHTEPGTSGLHVVTTPAKEVKNTPTPKYKPTPTYTPPPVTDNFPLLATSTPPPIPKWNKARENLHKDYDLPTAPPLLIGFTRNWPILLQAVVSYITAGWPPNQIYVTENTGTHLANKHGQLTLQNPFYLNHTTLERLGVRVLQTPVLLSFAQLQNFFLSQAYDHGWAYYFWSHMDVLAISYEEGIEGWTPAYWDLGYKSLYELACRELSEARKTDERWGIRFFAYDHLALVNPKAYEDVGGWDTLIPYYITDCDMHARLAMRNWSLQDARAGIITDVSTALDDLRALYRDPSVVPAFTDPNPPPSELPGMGRNIKRHGDTEGNTSSRGAGRISSREEKYIQGRFDQSLPDIRGGEDVHGGAQDFRLEYWKSLQRIADSMFHYKHGNRGRNTWQAAQKGGEGEPFYYSAAGLTEGIDVITEAGREVFRKKWGHRDCDLIDGGGLGFEDQWRVEKDWE